MVVLGLVERTGGHDLGRDRLLEALGDLRLRRLGQTALLVIAVENGAAVLAAMVAELAILRERIDVVPEHVEKLLVADLGWIEGDLHRLGMAGAAVRDLFVARIGDLSAGIAGRGAEHARHLVEVGLHAPEAAAGKRGDLLLRCALPRCARDERKRECDGDADDLLPETHVLLPRAI